ncbi:GGDEF domain-containing protein [Halomonas urumqiensis]|uniref:diguanylate cyclase n=1 Tax=Halomonas urumqiensis TaxID=1684789 RepID=A0A2N7UPV2_9GAMM|nr:GGDEF domain-containing protein [Halomonas urumqiensis]PMR82469.1 GGDEF domain-containing protein [Halomonas urumqiensis]PTB04050.1 GGDEF domain-containing protein [Halomonas urumqiensis]GHE19690.1 hypothetical protein GCM10017767_02110 [Halomonas urumqiensis]
MISQRDTRSSADLPPLPEGLRKQLADCQTLPSLPAAVARVLMVARFSEASLFDYARAIEEDPALTLRLLSLANSVFYSRHRSEVHTCQEAVSRIGLDATLAAVMSFGLARVSSAVSDQCLDRLWQRAIVAALTARHLAQHLCPDKAGVLFTVALLQDIGVLAVQSLDQQLYHDLCQHADDPLDELCGEHDRLARHEYQAYGCDHASIGAWLAASWGMPMHLARGIADSHGEFEVARIDMLCLRLSGPVADAWLSDNPTRAFVHLLKRLERLEQPDTLPLAGVLDEVKQQLPSMAELLEITSPPQFDNQTLLAEAQQHLFRQTLMLAARLDAHQAELESLRQRQSELERRSRIDALTGLANRAWLEEQLQERFTLCQDQARDLSLVFIDLDHFKRLNDTHGHQLGDQVLENFATTLQESIREGDLAGRYGGEEFLVILPDEHTTGATIMAARLTERLGGQPMAHADGKPLYVSVSIGIASLREGNFATPRDMIDAADHSMYRVKRSGRGGVATSHDSDDA